MTDPSPLSVGLGFLAFAALALAILVVSALVFRDRVADAPLEPCCDDRDSTTTVLTTVAYCADHVPCSDIHPHRMIPTSYGWRCANDCGERWLVEEDDDLAAADFALWSIENDWEVEA